MVARAQEILALGCSTILKNVPCMCCYIYRIHPSSQPHQLKIADHTFRFPGWTHDHPEVTDLATTWKILWYLRTMWKVQGKIYCSMYSGVAKSWENYKIWEYAALLRLMFLCCLHKFYVIISLSMTWESLLNPFLYAGCFFQSSAFFTSLSVQLNGLEIENTI